MTLKNSQVERLYNYLASEYQNKLKDLESERINKIRESDEYKQLQEKIEIFLTSVGIEDAATHALAIVTNKFDVYTYQINTYDNITKMRSKLAAILSTLPDSLSFEEVVKLVDEKLEFEQIINQ